MKKKITIIVVLFVLAIGACSMMGEKEEVKANLTYHTTCKTYAYSDGGYAIATLPKHTAVAADGVKEGFAHVTWIYEDALQSGWVNVVHLDRF